MWTALSLFLAPLSGRGILQTHPRPRNTHPCGVSFSPLWCVKFTRKKTRSGADLATGRGRSSRGFHPSPPSCVPVLSLLLSAGVKVESLSSSFSPSSRPAPTGAACNAPQSPPRASPRTRCPNFSSTRDHHLTQKMK